MAVVEILSVRAAGNYVEFHLADGRRPLMRATLSSLESELGRHGFLRTPRSWVINPLRLRALEPEGSGDWRVLLEGGAEASYRAVIQRRWRCYGLLARLVVDDSKEATVITHQ